MEMELNGSWVGLARWKDARTIVDYFSSPDGWQTGFDIVFRLIFIARENNFEAIGLSGVFQEAFKCAFDLENDHFETKMWEPGGVFWRIYWDKDAFDINLLEKCEAELSKCGERNNAAVIVLEETIIPRSRSHIANLIKANIG